MDIKKFESTTIPSIFSKGLFTEQCYDIADIHAAKILDVLVTGVTYSLAANKSKSYPTVFKFSTPSNEFIAAAIIQYIENEDDATNPGNWNYSWTFYEDDIQFEKANVIDPYDVHMSKYFRSSGMNKYGLVFDDVSWQGDIFSYMMNTIKKYLMDSITDSNKETIVDLEGIVQFRAGEEDGKVVISIEPDGEIKQIIKDDKAIEV